MLVVADVGVLSYEYEQARALGSKIDEVLRAAREGRVARQEQTELGRMLRGLVDLLDPLAARPEDAVATLSVPVGLARRLREQDDARRGLPLVAQRLSGGELLSSDDVALLEQIASLTEREASVVFRRMVRR